MRRGMTISLCPAVFSIIAAPAFAGGTHDEFTAGGDAGSLPSTAQRVEGSGSLGHITGETGAEGTITDFQDMYKIRIADPMNFSASTVGGSLFDTQLWLFDLQGRGLLANDNDLGSMTAQSVIPAMANDGTGQIIPGDGVYYLAISGGAGSPDLGGSGDDPLSAGGLMFFQAIPEEVSGPDGPGGGPQSITHWLGNGETGAYEITLHGCEFLGEPIPSHSEWTLIILTLLLLTAGTILLRRKPVAKPAA